MSDPETPLATLVVSSRRNTQRVCNLRDALARRAW